MSGMQNQVSLMLSYLPHNVRFDRQGSYRWHLLIARGRHLSMPSTPPFLPNRIQNLNFIPVEGLEPSSAGA